jgi:uncharacterized membrane protein YdfJ with MMPL/SSD domain
MASATWVRVIATPSSVRCGRGPGAFHDQDSDLTHVLVGYRGEADDRANISLVRQIRAETPSAGATEVLVGGAGGPALAVDSNDANLAALPGALLYIVVVTLVLLFFALRSALLPIKAIFATFLSMATSFGIVVARRTVSCVGLL